MSSSSAEDHGSVPNRGPAVFAVTTATLALASVFVGARMICRCCIVRRVTWDDRIMFLAWLLAVCLSTCIDYGVMVGLGKYDAHISVYDWPKLRRAEYVFSILYNPALMAAKTSILIFYLRLAKNTQIVLRYASWVTLVIVNVAGLVLTLLNIFQCNPVAAAWMTESISAAKCIPLLTEFICAAPVNVVTDLAILALPIPVLTGMRLHKRQKAILVITFSLGVFVTVVDVVRIYYLQRAILDVPTGISDDPNSRFGGSADFAWNASLSFMWSAVEVNVGIACACIPTLKPLILKLLPAMLYDPDGTRLTRTSKSISDAELPPPRHVASVVRESTAALDTGRSNGEHGGENGLGMAADTVLTDDEPMTAMEFLAASESRNPSGSTQSGLSTMIRAQTNGTLSTNSVENGIYFGFVNMTKPKSMLRANAADSVKYCTLVGILFFLWGISYGLLNTLNNAIGVINNMTDAQTLGLTSAYFGGGYFFGPLLVGEWILRRDEHNRSKRHGKDIAGNVGGYKVTFIVGLCIYGIGTIIFWPSAVTNSYGGYMLSTFVVGFGLSVLEVAANSFMILCGPPDYGETRLLLAQAVQGAGSVVSGLLAEKVFFTGISRESMMTKSSSINLINVQWTYLSITLLCVALGLFFFYMPLPEVSDGELELAANKLPLDPQQRSVGGLQLRTVSLVLAVFAQYTYVAAQESNSIYFRSLLVSVLPGGDPTGSGAVTGTSSSGSGSTVDDPDKPPGLSLSIPDYLLIAHTAFTLSRIVAGGITYLSVSNRRLPQPRTLLLIFVMLCFLFSLLPVVLHPANADMMVIPVMLFYFAEGPIWPLIFAIGLRGQGRRTKRAAAFITMGGSGPAFFPFVMYGIIHNGGSVQTAYLVIMALHVVMVAYPLFLMLSPSAKLMVDPNPVVRAAMQQQQEQQQQQEDDARSADLVLHSGRNSVRLLGPKSGGVLSTFSKGFGTKGSSERRDSSQTHAEHSEGLT
ncbi:hypothetical protein E4U43_000033 [Claviceps pusilla]|uniref:Rhodopsin domain-containing protein n=1 Tax=Claviceps pusilla TaxID=123648 RepID=A0A9P7NAF7_9HYPO|nr:hypothetical protein E4U43_000033 [Claviceps pusilla]